MGFLDWLAQYMANSRRKMLEKKLNTVNSDIKKQLIQMYGSWDKVPDWRKKYFHFDEDGNYISRIK